MRENRTLGRTEQTHIIGFVTVLPGPVATDMLKGVPKNIPFIHQPDDEARYIVEQVFKRKTQIEPSWFYASLFRILNWLPDCLRPRH